MIWVFASRMSDFVEERFDRESGMGMPNGTPPLNGHAYFGRMEIDL